MQIMTLHRIVALLRAVGPLLFAAVLVYLLFSKSLLAVRQPSPTITKYKYRQTWFSVLQEYSLGLESLGLETV